MAEPRMPAGTPESLAKSRACARERRTITYGELLGSRADTLDAEDPRPLAYIRDELCISHGRPWLNALIVSQEPQPASDCYWPEGFGDRIMNKDRWWNLMVHLLLEYDWSDVKR